MPSPVPDLPDECLIAHLQAGSLISRVHWRANDPFWFGPAPGDLPGGRFDAPAGEFRTLYAAQEVAGAFAESVLRKANRIISRKLVEKRAWSVLAVKRDLELALLYGPGLAWHGVTNDICAGDDYAASQALALAFHGRGLDGIAYRARHNNDEICCALFDRVAPSDLELVETRNFADERTLTDALMRQHGAVWDPGTRLPDLGKAG